MKLRKNIVRIMAILVTFTFFFHDMSFALGPALTSTDGLRPGTGETREAAVGMGLRALAVKKGDASRIRFDSDIPDEFDGDEVAIKGVRRIDVDYNNLPGGWEKHKILRILQQGVKNGSRDPQGLRNAIMLAFQCYVEDEARLPKDKVKLIDGWWPVDEASGKLPLARVEPNKDGTYIVVIHYKLLAILEEWFKNDLWYAVDFPGLDKPRVVSLAVALFELVAKHEMTDLVKVLGARTAKDNIHYEGHLTKFRAQDVIFLQDEAAANRIPGRYKAFNMAAKLFLAGSYCFRNETRYHNSVFARRLRWFFDKTDRLVVKEALWEEFPLLEENMILRRDVFRIARMFNHDYFSRRGRRTLMRALELSDIQVSERYKREYEQRRPNIIEAEVAGATGAGDKTAPAATKGGVAPVPLARDKGNGLGYGAGTNMATATMAMGEGDKTAPAAGKAGPAGAMEALKKLSAAKLATLVECYKHPLWWLREIRRARASNKEFGFENEAVGKYDTAIDALEDIITGLGLRVRYDIFGRPKIREVGGLGVIEGALTQVTERETKDGATRIRAEIAAQRYCLEALMKASEPPGLAAESNVIRDRVVPNNCANILALLDREYSLSDGELTLYQIPAKTQASVLALRREIGDAFWKMYAQTLFPDYFIEQLDKKTVAFLLFKLGEMYGIDRQEDWGAEKTDVFERLGREERALVLEWFDTYMKPQYAHKGIVMPDSRLLNKYKSDAIMGSELKLSSGAALGLVVACLMPGSQDDYKPFSSNLSIAVQDWVAAARAYRLEPSSLAKRRKLALRERILATLMTFVRERAEGVAFEASKDFRALPFAIQKGMRTGRFDINEFAPAEKMAESRPATVAMGEGDEKKTAAAATAPAAATTPRESKGMVAVDLGASGGKCFYGIFDPSEGFSMREIHRFPHEAVPFYIADGSGAVTERTYWNDILLFDNIVAGLRAYVRNKYGRLDSIGIDTWGADGQFVDRKTGDVLGKMYAYRDHRLDDMVDAVKRRMDPRRIYELTGIHFQPFNGSSQLLWFVLNRPDLLNPGNIYLPVPSLFYYYLGGVKKVDSSWASVTQLMDAGSRQWSREILDALGIPLAVMPDIVEPGTVVGSLHKGLADDIGIGRVQLIAAASHDTASAFAAAPVENADEALIISSGTWSLVGKLVPNPVTTSDAQAAGLSNEGGIGNIRLLKNCMGAWLVQELRRIWKLADGKEMEWAEMNELAASAPAFTAFIDPDDKSFYNPKNMEKAIADYCVKTGQKAPADRGTFMRVVYESLALKYRVINEEICRVCGNRTRTVNIVGGGSKNELLNQFTANALGLPVAAGPEEATAVGNFMVQAMGLGIIRSMREAQPIIERAFPIKKYSPVNREDWDRAYERFVRIVREGARQNQAAPATVAMGEGDEKKTTTAATTKLKYLVPHTIANALISLAIDSSKSHEALANGRAGFVNYDRTNDIYWFGSDSADNLSFRDIFEWLAKSYHMEDDGKASVQGKEQAFLEILARAGLIYKTSEVTVPDKIIEIFEETLSLQMEHFGVDTGRAYIMSRFRGDETIVKHARLERKIHLKMIETIFGDDIARYRLWRTSDKRIKMGISVTHNDTIGWDVKVFKSRGKDMSYEDFLQEAHRLAQGVYPVIGTTSRVTVNKAFANSEILRKWLSARGSGRKLEPPTAALATISDAATPTSPAATVAMGEGDGAAPMTPQYILREDDKAFAGSLEEFLAKVPKVIRRVLRAALSIKGVAAMKPALDIRKVNPDALTLTVSNPDDPERQYAEFIFDVGGSATGEPRIFTLNIAVSGDVFTESGPTEYTDEAEFIDAVPERLNAMTKRDFWKSWLKAREPKARAERLCAEIVAASKIRDYDAMNRAAKELEAIGKPAVSVICDEIIRIWLLKDNMSELCAAQMFYVSLLHIGESAAPDVYSALERAAKAGTESAGWILLGVLQYYGEPNERLIQYEPAASVVRLRAAASQAAASQPATVAMGEGDGKTGATPKLWPANMTTIFRNIDFGKDSEDYAAVNNWFWLRLVRWSNIPAAVLAEAKNFFSIEVKSGCALGDVIEKARAQDSEVLDILILAIAAVNTERAGALDDREEIEIVINESPSVREAALRLIGIVALQRAGSEAAPAATAGMTKSVSGSATVAMGEGDKKARITESLLAESAKWDKYAKPAPTATVIEYMLEMLPDYGPASENRIADDRYMNDARNGMRTKIWQSIGLIDSGKIEIINSNTMTMTDQVKAELDSINERRGGKDRDAIKINPYQDIKTIEDILSQKPENGALRIIVAEPSIKNDLIRLAQNRPDLFINVRVISMATPENYANMHSNEKSVCLARMITIAVLARLYKKGGSAYIEAVLRDMLAMNLGRDGDRKADGILAVLDGSDEERTDASLVVNRIIGCLGAVIMLSQKIGRELRLLKEFWTAA